jgi:hypothetical protein
MRTFLLAALIATAAVGPSFAAEYSFTNKYAKLVPQERLNSELTAAGFVIVGSACLDGVTCTVTASDRKMKDKSKAAASFSAITKKAEDRCDQATLLVRKLNQGTATQAEKDRLLFILAYLTFGVE